MNLSSHFIASTVVAAIFYPYIGPMALLSYAGGFLIDLDHYVVYVRRTKSINPLKAYYHYKNNKKNVMHEPFFFHTIEFLLVFGRCVTIWMFLLPAFLSYLVHMFMDVLDEIRGKGSIKNKSIMHALYLEAKDPTSFS